MMTETEQPTKQCHRCDKPVRMSLPEFLRDPNNWTTCQVCRDTLAIEAKEIGPIAAARAAEAKREAEIPREIEESDLTTEAQSTQRTESELRALRVSVVQTSP